MALSETPEGPAAGQPPSRDVTEARFQKLFDEADALSIQGYLPDGTVVYWNRASEKIYGYTAEEALGGNLLDLIIPPPMREEVAGAVRWMFEAGQGIPPGRLNLMHKSGRTVPVYSSHTVVSVPGQLPVMFCMDSDMTALDQAEAELRLAAAAFESQQGMFVTDADGVILRVNRTFERSTGYPATEVVGKTLRFLKSGRHPPAFYADMWRTLQEKGAWEGEVLNKYRDGAIHADWIAVSAVRDPSGRVTHYVGTQTDMTQRKEAEAKIIRLAFYDTLTQLPNRRLLLDRLKHAVAASSRAQGIGALFLIDVDEFKVVNDTLGHDFGDQLLTQLAARLTASIRKTDTAARVGADEFAVLIDGLAPASQDAVAVAESVGHKIQAALSQSYRLGQRDYVCSVSIGVTLFAGEGSSADDLLRQADLAMYEAKAAGRNALRFYDPEMQRAVSVRAEMTSGLREALRKQQFVLYYQPQVDVDGRTLGAEVLIRWNRPGRGVVSPGEFIPFAESAGLILPLGRWVLETACRQLASWAAAPNCEHLTLAVNISPHQFQQANFVAEVLEVLDRTGANPRRLKLELTESMLLDSVDDVVAKMSALKKHGIGFALDDFGTGYSSLAYLRRIPFDQLKIDQAFVRDLLDDPTCAAIAEAIVLLGRTMRLSVIAEGVEQEAQRTRLRGLGCEAFQGYLFGKPVPLADFERSLG